MAEIFAQSAGAHKPTRERQPADVEPLLTVLKIGVVTPQVFKAADLLAGEARVERHGLVTFCYFAIPCEHL
jgi:hypothetical protein